MLVKDLFFTRVSDIQLAVRQVDAHDHPLAILVERDDQELDDRPINVLQHFAQALRRLVVPASFQVA